jgi:hypothetical protein
VTRQEPHVDRCASAQLIKRFIDKKTVFQFITKEQKTPKEGTTFTLTKAEINHREGAKKMFDMVIQKYDLMVLSQIGDTIRDY